MSSILMITLIGLNTGTFKDWIGFGHSITRLVCCSDPHCTFTAHDCYFCASFGDNCDCAFKKLNLFKKITECQFTCLVKSELHE